jgi:hypothetical protein
MFVHTSFAVLLGLVASHAALAGVALTLTNIELTV